MAKKNFSKKSINENSFTTSIAKTPLWDKSQVREIDGLETVLTPLQFDGYSIGVANELVPADVLSMLFSYKDVAGEYHTEVVYKIPDTTCTNAGFGAKFSGLVHVTDVEDNNIRSYLFAADGKVYTITPTTNYVEEVCYYIDWYNCTSDGCIFNHTEELGCEIHIGGPDGGGGENGGYHPTPNGYESNVPTHHGGGIKLVGIKQIINKINPEHTCFLNALNAIGSSKIKSCIEQLYEETYVGTNNIHNLVFISGPLYDGQSGSPVPSKSSVSQTDPSTYIIGLGDYYAFDYTQEYWTSVILHEIVHSFIQKNNTGFYPNTTFTNSHEIMLNSWISEIRDALQNIYPNMEYQDATNLAVNGISDIFSNDPNQTFKYQMLQWMYLSYNTNANSIVQTVKAYQYGTKGNKCE